MGRGSHGVVALPVTLRLPPTGIWFRSTPPPKGAQQNLCLIPAFFSVVSGTQPCSSARDFETPCAIQGSREWHLYIPAAPPLSLFFDPSEKFQAHSRQMTTASRNGAREPGSDSGASCCPACRDGTRGTSWQMPPRANADQRCVLGLLWIPSQGALTAAFRDTSTCLGGVGRT